MNREELIKKLNELRIALQKTNSPYLKRDYGKAIKKLQRKLKYEV